MHSLGLWLQRVAGDGVGLLVALQLVEGPAFNAAKWAWSRGACSRARARSAATIIGSKSRRFMWHRTKALHASWLSGSSASQRRAMTRSRVFPAADLLRQLLREQAIRAGAAREMWDREQAALQGLALNAVRHGLPTASVAREAGVSRVTVYHWLRDTVPVPSRGLGSDSSGSGRVSGPPAPQDRGKAGDVLCREPRASALG